MVEESELAGELVEHLEQLKEIREDWEDDWEDVTTYVAPRRGNWNIDEDTEGERSSGKRYDSYPVQANRIMADGMQGNLIAEHLVWFALAMEDPNHMDLPYVADWLEACQDMMYGVFRRSNFYQAVGEYFQDGGALGISTMIVEATANPWVLRFDTRHPFENYIAENANGEVDTIFRYFKMANRQLVQRFGLQRLPETIRLLAEDAPYEKQKVLHAVRPRSDRDYYKMDRLNKPWESVYLLVDEKAVLSHSGFDTFPFLVWRWSKNSAETYGRSPSLDEIENVIRLNKMALTGMQADQLAVQPPLNVPKTMRGKERIFPLGYNYYDNANDVITPISLGQRPQHVDTERDRIIQTLDDAFMVEFFTMLARAKRQMTAYEIAERQGEKASVLGPVISRLSTEFLGPLISRVFSLLGRNGVLPKAPPSLMQAVNGRIKVEFMGPLAQAQRRVAQTQGLTSAVANVLPLLEVDPNVRFKFDWLSIAQAIASSHGMPQKHIREQLEVEQMIAAEAQRQQELMKLQAQATQADMYPKLAKAPERGSPAEKMRGAA